jgi:hypothetical protein
LDGEGDQVSDLRRAAVELHVPARHHRALRVADDVDLAGAGRGEHLVDEATAKPPAGACGEAA